MNRGKPLRQQSSKRRSEGLEYSHLRRIFLTARPICQICGTRPSVDVHHREGRGKNYLRVSTWIAVCREDHEWIHEHPNEARKKGLLK
jgi:hypothetical protein